MLYFGCIGGPGHYLFASPGRWASREVVTPWGQTPDGTLTPHENVCSRKRGSHYCLCKEIEGSALLHHKDGWTALSFWDRSVDKRGGCNSTFMSEGVLTLEEMMRKATAEFPNVMNRLRFPIVLASEEVTTV